MWTEKSGTLMSLNQSGLLMPFSGKVITPKKTYFVTISSLGLHLEIEQQMESCNSQNYYYKKEHFLKGCYLVSITH